MDRKDFKFHTQIRVRNYEVDWQGIVHNANYLLYFEVARLEYLKNLGIEVSMRSIQNESKIVLVRHEINYKSPAKFDELLDVYSRVSRIGNTSFAFEGLMFESHSGRLIAENIASHVWLNPENDEPVTVPEDFRKKVNLFEDNK